jgi:hypothetical protein
MKKTTTKRGGRAPRKPASVELTAALADPKAFVASLEEVPAPAKLRVRGAPTMAEALAQLRYEQGEAIRHEAGRAVRPPAAGFNYVHMSSRRTPEESSERRRRQATCPRIPVCLLEALRAGATPTVGAAGTGWAIKAEGRVLARRKHKADAEQLLQVARAEVATVVSAAAVIPEERRRQVLLTPQKPHGEAVRFEVVEAGSIVASHRTSDFSPDPAYPEGVQERAYHRDRGEQLKVRQGAESLNAELLLSRVPSALDGPPLVTEPPHAIALGGNGRTMMVQLAYRHDAEGARKYRAELVRRAAEFGHDSRAVGQMTAPVLVRVVEGLLRDSPRAELAAAVRRFNEGLTQKMDPTTRAVGQARVLSADTVRELGELLAGTDSTLRELMREKPAPILRALERDGVVTVHNRAEWTDAGSLTDAAKDTLEAMFLGLVLGSAERIRATPPALLAKVERAVPYLLAVRATLPPSFDLVPQFLRALDTMNDAKARGLRVDDVMAQTALFDAVELDATSRALVRLLDGSGPRVVGDAFRRWAERVKHDPTQETMFFEPPTPEAGLAALLGRIPNPCGCPGEAKGRKKNPRKVALVRCTRCDGSGRISPWAGHITWCPVCSGEGKVPAPTATAQGVPGQMRLVNPSRRRGAKVARRARSAPTRPLPPGRLKTEATTTRALAAELVRLYGGAGFPRTVTVTMTSGRRLGLRFQDKALSEVRSAGRADCELLAALRADLARLHPLV